MGFRCGIVGLPNVGKSTLFNALTSAGAEASNYPFCTIEPNIGVVTVPDERLQFLGRLFKPQQVIATAIEFVDIAGLVRGASRGEGLGNQFLAHIREVDAIVHVVRCFDDPNVVHVDGSIDPHRDIEIVETELQLRDLDTVERRLAETEKRAKGGDKKTQAHIGVLEQLRAHLSSGRLAQSFPHPDGDAALLFLDLHLLTDKPIMYVCNVPESDSAGGNSYVDEVRKVAAKEHARVLVVSAAVEAEIAQLPVAERKDFLESLGVHEAGMDRLIREGYALLNLMTFYTVGPKEARAWTAVRNTHAPQAAGIIHSDFERGFIRAEIMKYSDLERLGSEHAVREKGLLHVEGKEYVIQDGDIAYFRFNV